MIINKHDTLPIFPFTILYSNIYTVITGVYTIDSTQEKTSYFTDKPMVFCDNKYL